MTGELGNKIDSLWEIFWNGGITNPLDVVEQMTYLMFIKDLDDVSRGSELTVNTGLRNLRKQILIHIAANISLMELFHHGIDLIHGIHNFGKHQRCIHLKDCIVHVFTVCTVFVPMKIFYKGEYPFLNDGIHSLCREVMEGGPL